MNIFLDSSKLSFKSDNCQFFQRYQIDLSKLRKRLLTTLENYLKQIFSEKKDLGSNPSGGRGYFFSEKIVYILIREGIRFVQNETQFLSNVQCLETL